MLRPSTILPCVCLAIGLMSVGPPSTDAAPRKSKNVSRSEDGRSFALRNRSVRPKRRVTVQLPLGPGSVYQDYPFLYSRGHYPTHIGGYSYYPPPLYWYREPSARYWRR
jgi:hypothetical protein